MALTEAEKRYKKKYLEGKKQIQFCITEDTMIEFNEKLKKDKLSKQEVLETAVYRYLNDELPMYKKIEK